jgi:hypothetical protein
MRPTVARSIAAVALTALCTLPLTAAPPSTGTHPSRVPAARATVAEPHPQINAAIRALVRARLHLKNAAHDFGGHRVAAIGAIDAALVQLKLALDFDKD